MDELDHWRLCDELSVIQAALLVIGVDPAGEVGAYCDGWQPHERPRGYEAAKAAIASALRRELISGELVPVFEYDINGNICGDVPGSIDLKESRVDVGSLRAWLGGRGFRSGFFFPDAERTPDYLDPAHPRYSAKLAAAVKVWQAMEDGNLLSGKSERGAMEEWLTSRYRELGLVWKGKINKTGIEDTAKVANWNDGGGAPRTPGSE
ncbi:hypothetical protein D3C78_478150 [compost metagenome]